MTESTPPPEPVMTAEQKLKAKRFNERLKLVAAFFHSLALAVLGLGALRLVFDPGAARPGFWLILLAIIGAVVLEAIALYILGKLKAEN